MLADEVIEWGVPRSTSSADAIGIAYCCDAGCRHPGAGAFLVSASLLRPHGLLPGRLRSVGGDCFRLVLRPDRQLVQARASAAESGPPLPRMPRARPRTPLHLRVHRAECVAGGRPPA